MIIIAEGVGEIMQWVMGRAHPESQREVAFKGGRRRKSHKGKQERRRVEKHPKNKEGRILGRKTGERFPIQFVTEFTVCYRDVTDMRKCKDEAISRTVDIR